MADLIAAGEVVERPASVAKELLENALDAGASAVSVELQQGGMTYLRVTDNGCGIAPEQLPTAFLRHATSKLHRRRIWRPSARWASGVRRWPPSPPCHGWISSPASGRRTAARPCIWRAACPAMSRRPGCPEGTTICVRELFYNTPARMKFMKKDSAEGAAATGVVTQLALSHPDVSFKLLRDGQEVLHTPGDGQLLSRRYTPRWGGTSPEVCCPWSGAGGDVRVSGFVTKPRRRSRHTRTAAVLRQRAAGQEPAAHRRAWRRPTATGC